VADERDKSLVSEKISASVTPKLLVAPEATVTVSPD